MSEAARSYLKTFARQMRAKRVPVRVSLKRGMATYAGVRMTVRDQPRGGLEVVTRTVIPS